MKRAFIYLSIITMALGITAFECSSAELTGAKLYLNQKQYDKAKESLMKEVEKNPKSDEGWYLLGFLHGEEGNFQEMLNAYDKSLSISKKFEAGIKDSKKYYWATSFNKGVSFFNKATKTEAQDSVKMFFNKAIDEFKSAILCEPDSIATQQNLAYAYLNLGDNDAAIPPLEKLTKQNYNSDVFALLGQIYTDKGQKLMDQYKTSKVESDSVMAMDYYNKAITVLESGRKAYPNDGEILLRVSNAYIGANKLDVALEAFKTGVEKEPENKFYHYNYGVLLLNSKDFPAAEEQFNAAIKIDPEYTNAIYNLGVTYVRWGAEMRDKMEAEGKDDTSYQEKFKLALPHLEKYLETNPKEPAVWELLGRVYANLGMKDKSEAAFKKADEVK